MADEVVKLAQKEGVDKLLCEIDKRSNTFNSAVASVLGYGFNLIDEGPYYLTFHKDL